MRWLVLLMFAPLLHAHPLDDRADLMSEVRVVEDGLELWMQFRYKDVIGSYTEFRAGLDVDGDGTVTPNERNVRFRQQADEMALALVFTLDGKPLFMDPDFKRFALRDLERPNADPDAGMETTSARIEYEFVFTWQGKLAPGLHRVEYSFTGVRNNVANAAIQMIAMDTRGTPRKLEGTYDLQAHAFPRLTFDFEVKSQAVITPTPPTTPDAPPAPVKETPPLELPQWLTLASGVGLLLAGVAVTGRSLWQKRKPGSGLLFMAAGAAITLAALVRLGAIKLL